jgi:hypothetical protein
MQNKISHGLTVVTNEVSLLILSGATKDAWTTLDISSAVPANAKIIACHLLLIAPPTDFIAIRGSDGRQAYYCMGMTTELHMAFDLSLTTNNIDYYITAGVTGFEIRLVYYIK